MGIFYKWRIIMSETRYIISDASKQLDVEPHVLRYWEEELEMEIPRNEMGHRYYRDKDLKILKCVKDLKQQGFQLRAIKLILPEIETSEDMDIEKILGLKEELNQRAELGETQTFSPAEVVTAELVQPISPEKMTQFQEIMNKIIASALKDNNQALSQRVGEEVSNNVIKEMDYLLRVKDDREEERFKKLDETIRGFQKARQEAAAAQEPSKKEKRRKRRKFLRK